MCPLVWAPSDGLSSKGDVVNPETVRLFLYNLGTDVAIAVGVAVTPLVSSDSIDWRLVAVLAGKTAIATAVAGCVRWLRERKGVTT